ncbi:MAG: class I SAM-dependent methyltransferase [Lachnospiraceae bacterium]|nr:class I SAM-dependent methyltransferase [Lachnospiraceae bacterium]MDD3617261.1 class I SAM-dependent methyltransferase [Lachnospiraceae bacterium]
MKSQNVSKTLYIPLYGKALVSKKEIILYDPKAEHIWSKEGFALTGKAKSKWLAYYMGMRSAVFDRWLADEMRNNPESVILHIGCGMDSRIDRVGADGHLWFDVDFPDVITGRRKYFTEDSYYRMICSDARNTEWLQQIPLGRNALIIMEGFSMYLSKGELLSLLRSLTDHFSSVNLLMDVYTVMSAKISKYKNPIGEVGITNVHGIDNPIELIDGTCLSFVQELNMTPDDLIGELHGFEKTFFRLLFAGGFSKKLYRLYEFKME